MNSLRRARGGLVARLLAGAWRGASSSPPPISSRNLEEVLEVLLNSGAGALAWRQIRGSQLANTAAGERLHTAYRMQSLRAAANERRIGPLMEKFRTRGIEPILIKGWSLARLYPEPGLRPYSDVDLVVAPGQLGAARALLADDALGVDLEHDEIIRFDRRSWSDIYRRSRLAPIGNTQVRLLGHEDQLRALCIHFLKHGGWGPLWLCDIALLVESRPAGFNWDLCLGETRQQRSWIGCALQLAHCLLGMELQGVPLEGDVKRIPDWVAATVLEQWGSPPVAYRERFRSYLRRPGKIREAFADRWPPNPIVSTLTCGASFGAWPRCFLQLAEILTRLGKCALGSGERTPGIGTSPA